MTPLRSRRLVVAFAVPLLFASAACSSDDGGSKAASSGASSASAPAAGDGTSVSLKLLQFQPAKLTVKVGTKVTWTDSEPITHTVTSGEPVGIDANTGLRSGQKPDGKFDAKLATTGDTFSYTFKAPGTYQYYCSIHQGMNATVVVTK